MSKKIKNVLIILIPVIVILTALFIYKGLTRNYNYNSELIEPEFRLDAMDFTIYDYEGNKYTLSDFDNKPIVLNLWATWCSFCITELPSFQKAYDKYGNDINFVMIDIADGNREKAENAKAFIDGNGYTFPVYYDNDLDVYQKYLIAFPTTIIIDKHGDIAYIQSGMMHEEKLFDLLKELTK